MLGLTKLAASFDARRNKQYWQLLKRLHGGNDEAINTIKTTGDSGIYHGTSAQNIPGVLQNGLRPGSKDAATMAHGNEYGDGIYLGDRNLALKYTDPDAKYFHDKINAQNLLQLKKPSELRGTKSLYPSPGHVVKVDTQNPEQVQDSYMDFLKQIRQGRENRSGEEAKVWGDGKYKALKSTFGHTGDLEGMSAGTMQPQAHQQLRAYGKVPEFKPMNPGQMVLQHSTISPHLIRQAAQIFLGIEKG
jgi:hypothetical protein